MFPWSAARGELGFSDYSVRTGEIPKSKKFIGMFRKSAAGECDLCVRCPDLGNTG